jgi:hypothetical protein
VPTGWGSAAERDGARRRHCGGASRWERWGGAGEPFHLHRAETSRPAEELRLGGGGRAGGRGAGGMGLDGGVARGSGPTAPCSRAPKLGPPMELHGREGGAVMQGGAEAADLGAGADPSRPTLAPYSGLPLRPRRRRKRHIS